MGLVLMLAAVGIGLGSPLWSIARSLQRIAFRAEMATAIALGQVPTPSEPQES